MDFSKGPEFNRKDTKPDMTVNKLETENQFWFLIEDARNQFNGFKLFMDEESTDQDMIDFASKYNYLTINEILKKDNKALSDKLLNNGHVKNLIKTFDNLISRIKVFKTKKELSQILEESDEFFGRFNLELEK